MMFGYRIHWEGGWSYTDNGVALDLMLADLARQQIDITTVRIQVVITSRKPLTVDEAIEKGRLDYKRVTGQSE